MGECMNVQQKALAAATEALTWVGTPYHHQGRVKGRGVDCGMLICEVYYQVGLMPFIDPRPYPSDWHLHQQEQKYLEWVLKFADKVDDPQPGDVVLYHFGKCISHGGIVIEWPTIVHAYNGQGCIRADGIKGRLCKRLSGFYRMRGM